MRPRADAGFLVTRYLTGTTEPLAYVEQVSAEADLYNGFNLLVVDVGGAAPAAAYCCNRAACGDAAGPQQLRAGQVYAMSNSTLDVPWPKVAHGRREFERIVDRFAAERDEHALIDALFALLDRAERYPDDALPRTGVPIEWERHLSSIFVEPRHSPYGYGTRSQAVLLVTASDRALFLERHLDVASMRWSERATFEFHLERDANAREPPVPT